MRSVVALALLVVLLTQPAAWAAPARQTGEQPNIVFILLDDLDVRSIEHMPLTMELLASEGLTFRNFLTTLPGCCPARASVLRGQYVHNHGVLRSSGPSGGFGR